MILHIIQSKAPDDIIIGLGHVKLCVAILIVAMALATGGLSATIAVSNQIGLLVVRIKTGSNP